MPSSNWAPPTPAPEAPHAPDLRIRGTGIACLSSPAPVASAWLAQSCHPRRTAATSPNRLLTTCTLSPHTSQVRSIPIAGKHPHAAGCPVQSAPTRYHRTACLGSHRHDHPYGRPSVSINPLQGSPMIYTSICCNAIFKTIIPAPSFVERSVKACIECSQITAPIRRLAARSPSSSSPSRRAAVCRIAAKR